MICGADEEDMPGVLGAASQQREQHNKDWTDLHAMERGGFNAASCCIQNPTDFEAT